jgi:hypothetical protein
MTARLTAEFLAKALIRRVNDAGGSAAVLARGDATSGAILVLGIDRDGAAGFWERGIGPDGKRAILAVGPRESSLDSVEDYWRRRRRSDPDLWVVELSIASAERFVAETMPID